MEFLSASYPVVAINAQALNASSSPSVTGFTIDSQGYNYVLIDLSVTANNQTITNFKVQSSDDASTWSDVANSSYTGSSASANGIYRAAISLEGGAGYHRYWRAVVAGNGTTASNTYVYSHALLGDATYLPVDKTLANVINFFQV